MKISICNAAYLKKALKTRLREGILGHNAGADREPKRLLAPTKEKWKQENVKQEGSEIADFAHGLGNHKNS